jgi:Rrf2 family protein
MKLSTKGRYGLRAMIELSMRPTGEPVMVRDIAAAQVISEDYLELVLISLRRAGLVRSIRGASGGYQLAKSADDITALEITEAVEGPIGLVDCTREPELCCRSGECVAHELWSDASNAMRSVLQGTTLAQLRDRQIAKRSEPMFHI